MQMKLDLESNELMSEWMNEDELNLMKCETSK